MCILYFTYVFQTVFKNVLQCLVTISKEFHLAVKNLFTTGL